MKFQVSPYSLTIERLKVTDCAFCRGQSNHELANEEAEKSVSICTGCIKILHGLLSAWLRQEQR